METHSDKLIQQKIDSVNSLPEGYSPNLNNKWEILAAGLTPKKKPLFLYFNKISAIAAMLLLIGGISLFFIKTIKRKEAVKPVVSVTKPIEKEKIVSKTNKTESPILVVKSDRIPTENKRIEKPIEIVQSESIKNDSFILLEKPAIILAEATPKKTKRFTEIDFNEPIKQENTPPTNMAFNQRFSFKIGASLQNNAGNANTIQATTFGLTKQFN
ncbi:MAG: hypothetical protein ACOYMA_16400 [Bacteroidia bacterium]